MSISFLQSSLRTCLACLFAIAAGSSLSAQVTTRSPSGKGSIAGQVTDSGGGVLQGAQISVDPGGGSAVSNAQGRFLISGLNSGDYTVTVKYVGFADLTKKVTVSAGETVNADALLSVASQNLQVLVTAVKPRKSIGNARRTTLFRC